MQLDRIAAADVADLLGMQFDVVCHAARGLRDDGEMDPAMRVLVVDDRDLSDIWLAKNRRKRLPGQPVLPRVTAPAATRVAREPDAAPRHDRCPQCGRDLPSQRCHCKVEN